MEQPGHLLRLALAAESPLQIVGVINAFAAQLAKSVGFRAVYLSGAGIANAQFSLPDLGLTSLNDVTEECLRITGSTDLPLLVDADTGWGNPLNVSRTFKMLSRAGAAGAHIEDQDEAKRCGHRSGKKLISQANMVSKISAAVDGRCDPSFWVMARTDALAGEGQERTLERALAYEAAGADAIFLEAATSLTQYQFFVERLKIPVLANVTEFGQTPLFTTEELKGAGVKMALYPLTAFRIMSAAALNTYSTLRRQGTQSSLLPFMMTRDNLYGYLDYQRFEYRLDEYQSAQEKNNGSD